MQSSLRMPLGRPGAAAPRRCRGAAKATAIADVLEQGSTVGKSDVPAGLNKFSSRVTQPKSQGASQAMLYGTGFTAEDMNKPQARSHMQRKTVLLATWSAPHRALRRPDAARVHAAISPPPPPPVPHPQSPPSPGLLFRPPSLCRWASPPCGGRATPATCT